MPFIGTKIVHAEAVQLIGDWIWGMKNSGSYKIPAGALTSAYTPPPVDSPFNGTTATVKGRVARAQEVKLIGNSPNPFFNITKVKFYMPKNNRENVSIIVSDVRGRTVRTLSLGKAAPGLNEVTLNASDQRDGGLASGVYFYQILYGKKFLEAKPMIVLKGSN